MTVTLDGFDWYMIYGKKTSFKTTIYELHSFWKYLSSQHTENNQSICIADQLIGFYLIQAPPERRIRTGNKKGNIFKFHFCQTQTLKKDNLVPTYCIKTEPNNPKQVSVVGASYILIILKCSMLLKKNFLGQVAPKFPLPRPRTTQKPAISNALKSIARL